MVAEPSWRKTWSHTAWHHSVSGSADESADSLASVNLFLVLAKSFCHPWRYSRSPLLSASTLPFSRWTCSYFPEESESPRLALLPTALMRTLYYLSFFLPPSGGKYPIPSSLIQDKVLCFLSFWRLILLRTSPFNHFWIFQAVHVSDQRSASPTMKPTVASPVAVTAPCFMSSVHCPWSEITFFIPVFLHWNGSSAESETCLVHYHMANA